jgi:hypothetical protein
MNVTYTIIVRRISDGMTIVRSVLTKDKDGKTAEQRATEAVLAQAGDGYIVQNVNLIPIDLDLTA